MFFGSPNSITESFSGDSVNRFMDLLLDPFSNKSNPVSLGSKLVERRSPNKSKVPAQVLGWCHLSWMIRLYISGTPLHIRSLITKPNSKADQSCIYPSPAKSVHLIGGQGSGAHHGMPYPPSPVWHPPLRYIVDCLHIWPLPRGRIHFGWHRCILTDGSFWFGRRGNSLHFSFIVNLSLVWSKIHQWKRSNICDCKYLVFAGWQDLNSWSWGEVAI